ncbi:MAG TPA: CBS domain-containing protein [Anaerolineales bacterium]|nr:CBS domain-containing protein [Anaerolineales bacterium]
MLVGERMSHPVISVHPDVSIQDALYRMNAENIRRLPVIDRRGILVGIVTERELLHASPSDATSLSVWEVTYLLSRIKVEDIMVKNVITTTEDTPIEEAARIMTDQRIGALPVVRGDRVVGIITETDLFKVFTEIMGAREPGTRITVMAANVPGTLVNISKEIYAAGGDIVAMATFIGESSAERELTFKITGADKDALLEALKPYIVAVIDVREIKAE